MIQKHFCRKDSLRVLDTVTHTTIIRAMTAVEISHEHTCRNVIMFLLKTIESALRPAKVITLSKSTAPICLVPCFFVRVDKS
jgi:hypothetical protein